MEYNSMGLVLSQVIIGGNVIIHLCGQPQTAKMFSFPD